jgi:hypothetical protein
MCTKAIHEKFIIGYITNHKYVQLKLSMIIQPMLTWLKNPYALASILYITIKIKMA